MTSPAGIAYGVLVVIVLGFGIVTSNILVSVLVLAVPTGAGYLLYLFYRLVVAVEHIAYEADRDPQRNSDSRDDI